MDYQNLRKTVLIVEDDKILSNALKVKFQNENFTVLTAFDGNEAKKIALSQHPDVITLDLLMPVKDGINFMDEIRQDNWGKTVPIIILTNLEANDKMVSKIIKDKPSFYLIKTNTNLESIVNKIKEILKI